MSLITCCPACQTMFKVSGEDLRVSDGWVRCGKCDGVFDASLHLQAMPLAAQATAVPADAPMPSFQPAQASLDREPAFSEPELEPEPLLNTPAAFQEVESSPGALRREDRSARPSFSEAPVSYSTRPARSAWRVVLWLLALAVLLVGLLAGARLQRQALVQGVPALLPMLDGLCRFSACDVQAPRLLSAIVIEGASMEEVSPASYQVQLLLKNAGDVAVDLPALTVTLTGLQGEVLATHIALPSQFAPGIPRLSPRTPLNVTFTFLAALSSASAAGAAPAASVEVAGTLAASAAPAGPVAPVAPAEPATPPVAVSGYRVIAFYP